MIDLATVDDLSGWTKLRPKIDAAVKSILGSPQSNIPDPQFKVMDELDFPGYARKRVNYFVDEWERVTAWLFVPEDAEDCPVILCLHDRDKQGKDVPAGGAGDPHLAFAQRLAELGYATLAPDCITAGERVLSSRVPFDSTSWYKENAKGCLLRKMLDDHMRAIDALDGVPGLDCDRIGVIGHGLGGANALLLGAMDERVRVTVASCGFAPFAKDDNVDRWVQDDALSLIPQLKSAVNKGEYPFDWEHVLAMVAPNPTLVITAENDDEVPATKHCRESVKAASAVYKLLGEGAALEDIRHKEGRRMTFDLLEKAQSWFDRWL